MNETFRKDIRIEQDSCQIVVKMWNEHSETNVREGQNVLILNLRTSVFKAIMSLNSTDETSIEVHYFYSIVQLFTIGLY